MENLDAIIVEHHLSLKICELCGRLFCQKDPKSAYCLTCGLELNQFPVIGSRKMRGRKTSKNFLVPSEPNSDLEDDYGESKIEDEGYNEI